MISVKEQVLAFLNSFRCGNVVIVFDMKDLPVIQEALDERRNGHYVIADYIMDDSVSTPESKMRAAMQILHAVESNNDADVRLSFVLMSKACFGPAVKNANNKVYEIIITGDRIIIEPDVGVPTARGIVSTIKEIVTKESDRVVPITCDLGAYELIRRYAHEVLIQDDTNVIDFIFEEPDSTINSQVYRDALLNGELDAELVRTWLLLLCGEKLILTNGKDQHEFFVSHLLLANRLRSLFNEVSMLVRSGVVYVKYDQNLACQLRAATGRLRGIVPMVNHPDQNRPASELELMFNRFFPSSKRAIYYFSPYDAFGKLEIDNDFTDPIVELHFHPEDSTKVYGILHVISGDQRTKEIIYPM